MPSINLPRTSRYCVSLLLMNHVVFAVVGDVRRCLSTRPGDSVEIAIGDNFFDSLRLDDIMITVDSDASQLA